VDLGFGRIVISAIDAPNILGNLVWSGWTVVQSDNATKLYADHQWVVEQHRAGRDAALHRSRQAGQPSKVLRCVWSFLAHVLGAWTNLLWKGGPENSKRMVCVTARHAAASVSHRLTPPHQRGLCTRSTRLPGPARARAGRRRFPGSAAPRVRSQCRFRHRGADYIRKSFIPWISGGIKC
jgi:hypothetical protein